MKKDFLAITDFTKEEILETLDLSIEIKTKLKRGEQLNVFEGKSLAMIFQKPSTRTRISFEVGMTQLGGHAVHLGPADIQLNKREAVGDVANTICRYVDIIMARLFGHEEILDLANNSSVPVINGLTDWLHPCQIMADIQTILEVRGSLNDLKVCYVGDGNNVANSWVNIAGKLPMNMTFAVPENYDPDPKLIETASANKSSQIEICRDSAKAVEGADVIYTDVWASMGQEGEAWERRKAFKNYQITSALMAKAAPGCIFMHCLPAHRGEEVTAEVIDGKQSVVFHQAENRLHVQKAIMVKLAG